MDAVIWLIAQIIQLLTWGLVIYIIIDLLVKFGVINAYNKVVQVVMGFLSRLFEPLLTPIRNIMPNLSGIDISPIILMLGLQFGFRLLVELFAYVLNRRWRHGDGNGWCIDFGCHVSTSIRQTGAEFSAAR